MWLDGERGICCEIGGEQRNTMSMRLYRPPAKRARDAKSHGYSGKICGVCGMHLHFTANMGQNARFPPVFYCIFPPSRAPYPHPGPGFKRWRLIQAALATFSFIKADLKFFSLIYTWVKIPRMSKYRVSMGLTRPSHNRANPAASPVSILYIGEIHTFEYIG